MSRLTALQLDLMQRCWTWIRDSPLGGHSWGCRAIDKLPEQQGPCNCGRDDLLNEVAAEAFRPVDTVPNGHSPLP